MNLKQLMNEQGMVLDKRVIFSTEDVKHLANYENESHGELLSVLHEFYDVMHQEIYDAQVEAFERFLEYKSSEG